MAKNPHNNLHSLSVIGMHYYRCLDRCRTERAEKQVFRIRIQLGQMIRIRIWNPGMDPGRPKLPPPEKKNLEISCLKSLNVLCRFLRRHMTAFEFWWRKFSTWKFVNGTNFVIKYLGLDSNGIQAQKQSGEPDPDSAKFFDLDPKHWEKQRVLFF